MQTDVYKTPCKMALTKSSARGCGTPFTIPGSPFMKKLGCGTGVSVYLMNRDGKRALSPWAIKKINSNCTSSQAMVFQRRLSTEAEVLKDLKHPNIIGYRGFTTAKDGSKCLAMEYGGDQSLNDLIEKRREEGLQAFPVSTIEKVALEVARALEYMHSEKVLHGDMKSSNIVIKGDFETVKVCDVGVCLQLDESMRVSDPKAEYIGTEPWTPKEVLEEGIITDKADIFAYGLTLWEMMSLSMPHLELLDSFHEDESFDEDDFEAAYSERLGTRPSLDTAMLGGDYQRMVELFCLCTEEDPSKRPSAAHIVQALESNSRLDVK